MAQQVLRLEVGQVQVAEQIEQRRIILKHFLRLDFVLAQRAKFQCERVFNTIVFAAVIRVWSGHGEPTAAVMV